MGRIVLADELLTSDSSRFWAAEEWQPGGPQRYLDKQFVRDWSSTITSWDRTAPGPEVPPDIVKATQARYVELFERITGTQWQRTANGDLAPHPLPTHSVVCTGTTYSWPATPTVAVSLVPGQACWLRQASRQVWSPMLAMTSMCPPSAWM